MSAFKVGDYNFVPANQRAINLRQFVLVFVFTNTSKLFEPDLMDSSLFSIGLKSANPCRYRIFFGYESAKYF